MKNTIKSKVTIFALATIMLSFVGTLAIQSSAAASMPTISLSVSPSSPYNVGLGKNATFTVLVTNTGTMILTNVVFTNNVSLASNGLAFKKATPPPLPPRPPIITWNLGNITTGMTKQIILVYNATKPGSWAFTFKVTSTEKATNQTTYVITVQ
jgi:uncharacterized repeat protein (TIGR01451 family)